MAKWLAKEFDWDTGRYTGNYYDIAEEGIVAVFVDSHFGNDSNAGTSVAPFKTLSAAITYLNANGTTWSRIFLNGIFSENVPNVTYAYHIIGCGGGRNGRTVLYNDTVAGTTPLVRGSHRWENIETLNYQGSPGGTVSGVWRSLNCFWDNFTWGVGVADNYIISYFSVFLNITSDRIRNASGNNNTFYNFTVDASYSIATNNLYNSHFYNITNNFGTAARGNLYEVIGQYYDLERRNIGLFPTSPLLFAGTTDAVSGLKNHVGAGYQSFLYNGLRGEMTENGGAVITNLQANASGHYEIVSGQTEGSIVTAIIDLGNFFPITKIDINNVFDFSAGQIIQGIFEPFTSPRMVLTISMKYGDDTTELAACPWLLIEYGKKPSYSGSGVSRVGNAADTYDPANSNDITARYLQFDITLKNNS